MATLQHLPSIAFYSLGVDNQAASVNHSLKVLQKGRKEEDYVRILVPATASVTPSSAAAAVAAAAAFPKGAMTSTTKTPPQVVALQKFQWLQCKMAARLLCHPSHLKGVIQTLLLNNASSKAQEVRITSFYLRSQKGGIISWRKPERKIGNSAVVISSWVRHAVLQCL